MFYHEQKRRIIVPKFFVYRNKAEQVCVEGQVTRVAQRACGFWPTICQSRAGKRTLCRGGDEWDCQGDGIGRGNDGNPESLLLNLSEERVRGMGPSGGVERSVEIEVWLLN